MLRKSHKGDDMQWRKRGLVERLMPPKLVEWLIENAVSLPPFAEKELEFIIAIVAGNTPEEANRHLSLLGELAKEHDAQTGAMACSLVVIDFREIAESKQARDSRRKLVAAIRERLGSNVKAVQGSAKGHIGYYGSKQHTLAYTFTFPGFESAIAVLARLKFGEIEELTQ